MMPLHLRRTYINTHSRMIDTGGVAKLPRNLKTHKTSSPDGFSARLLKEISSDDLALAATMLFQASLNQGTIPLSWEEACVVPLFKKGNRHLAS